MATVGYLQFAPVFGKVQENVATVMHALAAVEADVLVLPELAFTGYSFKGRAELEKLAEDPRKSATVEMLISLCRDRGFHLVTGFAEKQADRCYNSALLLGPKGIHCIYRKLHLFNREKMYFDPGDLPLAATSVNGLRVGMMVCFDWVFPEVARALALMGADVLCHPANLVLTFCQQTMVVRCIENFVFAVTANRHGTEIRAHGELTFTGQSQVVAPGGKVLHRSGADEQALFITEIDLALARNKRLTARNDLFADRRPAFYTQILKSGASG